MASCKIFFRYLILVLAVTLIAEISNVEGRGGSSGSGKGGGGGGRGGVRGGRGRGGVRGGRGRLGNSISRSGSSPFTKSTFTKALTRGSIYGSARYMKSSRYRSNPLEMPTICTNNYDKDSNGTTYGYFICPRAGEPEHHEYCCGDNRTREHCCEYSFKNFPLAGLVAALVFCGPIAIWVFLHWVYENRKKCSYGACCDCCKRFVLSIKDTFKNLKGACCDCCKRFVNSIKKSLKNLQDRYSAICCGMYLKDIKTKIKNKFKSHQEPTNSKPSTTETSCNLSESRPIPPDNDTTFPTDDNKIVPLHSVWNTPTYYILPAETATASMEFYI